MTKSKIKEIDKKIRDLKTEIESLKDFRSKLIDQYKELKNGYGGNVSYNVIDGKNKLSDILHKAIIGNRIYIQKYDTTLVLVNISIDQKDGTKEFTFVPRKALFSIHAVPEDIFEVKERFEHYIADMVHLSVFEKYSPVVYFPTLEEVLFRSDSHLKISEFESKIWNDCFIIKNYEPGYVNSYGYIDVIRNTGTAIVPFRPLIKVFMKGDSNE